MGYFNALTISHKTTWQDVLQKKPNMLILLICQISFSFPAELGRRIYYFIFLKFSIVIHKVRTRTLQKGTQKQ